MAEKKDKGFKQPFGIDGPVFGYDDMFVIQKNGVMRLKPEKKKKKKKETE